MKNLLKKILPDIGAGTLAVLSGLAVGAPGAYAEPVHQQSASQQTGTIKGVVAGADGEPLIGATVKVKGSKGGTMTDIDGGFSLKAAIGATLQVSYVGYKTLEVKATSSDLKITLQEDNEVLDEVVVVGYGSQKKASLTGAVSTLDTKIVQDKSVSTPLAALQGQIPGMVVTRSSSAPGREEWGYKIRGQASVNDPGALVIIDGVAGGNLNNIDPNDIASMSVLKDGAAAIYGSRAAGGVILVETKKGQNQKVKITYSGNVTVKTPAMQQKWMNMEQWAYAIEEATLNNDVHRDADGNWTSSKLGQDIGASRYWTLQAMKTHDPRFMGRVVDYNFPEIRTTGFMDYDMNDEVWGNAVSNSHALSFNGGNATNRFNIALSYHNDGSPMRSKWGDDNYRRYGIRANHDIELAKWVELGTRIVFERIEKKFPKFGANAANGNIPGSPMLTPSGLPFGWGGNFTPVVKTKFGGTQNENTNSFSINFQPKFHITKDLDLVGNIYFNPWDTNNMGYQNLVKWYDWHDVEYRSTNPNSSYVNREAKTVMKTLYQGYFNYHHTFAEAHNLAVMAGLSYEKERSTKMILEKKNLTVPELHSVNTATDYNKGSDEIKEWALASYYGRINYDYMGRYLVELIGRYDGSSKFIKGKKWSPFFGASVGWRISEEKFMRNAATWLDNLKIRASYGEVGNQNGIDNYDYIALVNLNTPSGNAPTGGLFGPSSKPSMGQTITQKNVVSLDRTWEKIKTMNVGLDFTVLNNRLTGTFEYFIKKNDNMLTSVTYPSVFGASAPKTNSGKMEVKGWELSLGWRDRIGNVDYWVNGNISDARNKLISMENATVKQWDKVTSNLEGYALGTMWGLEAYKLIENEQELEDYRKLIDAKTDKLIDSKLLSVGDMMYRDLDGDGFVTKKDVKLLGDNTPHYSYAINLGARWNNFDFSATFQGVGKMAVIRDKSAATMLVANTYQNQGAIWYGRSWSDIAEKLGNRQISFSEPVWDASGAITGSENRTVDLLLPAVNKDPNAVPRSTTNGTVRTYNYLYSDAWYKLQNGAYTRLKNITIGYTIPGNLTKRIGISNLRLYFTGNDLFEITHTKDGWDPETTGTNPLDAKAVYPFMRSYTFGINFTFN